MSHDVFYNTETIRGTTIPSARWITMAQDPFKAQLEIREVGRCSSVSTLSVRKRISTTTTTSGLRGRSTARCRCRSITRRTSTVFISLNTIKYGKWEIQPGHPRGTYPLVVLEDRQGDKRKRHRYVPPLEHRVELSGAYHFATRAGSTDGMNAATRRRMELRSLTRSVRRMARVSLKSRA